ncbi:MATE family efflux transporter [Aquabacterium sp. A7-Y]|uniref:MATE family efflux transporter n=1 Tax=Aquabacterium sp. A7-Y TaxID=1349605 RepID=UPI00223D6E06|nr:MATE family efflux transporter [Aquabacterium sp. A7-Y]MCW7538516.1 MATE family efflux transporter [Aquabacterium sp. A7-Y]
MPVDGVLNSAETQSLNGRLREALKISLPIMVSQFMLMAGGFISNLMLSRVDETSFAAGLLINSVQMSLVTVIFGVLYSLSPLIGRVIGEGRQLERVGQLFLAACSVALLVCVPTILLLYFARPILTALGQPAALIEACASYFHIYLWSVPAVGLISVCVQVLLGVLKQGVVLLYSVLSLLVSTLLSYLLIFGKFGFPALGLNGWAWAVSITAWLAALVLTGFILRHPGHRVYALTTLQRHSLRQSMGSIVRIGLPIAVQMGNEIFSFLVTTLMVGWLGVEALATQQVATRYLLMLVIPIIGLSQAVTVVTSKHFGAGRLGEVKLTGQAYVWMGALYSLIVLAAFALAPDAFVSVFIENRPENAAIYQTLAVLLVLIAIGQIFDAVRNILTGALRGLQDSKFPMQLSIVMIWVIGVPLAYLMGFTWNWGLVGITVAHDIVMAIGCAILWWHWKNKFKSTP